MQGTALQLQGTCTDELADFVLSPSGFLRHQYSGLCAALNPSAPGTEPASPAALASQNAAVEDAGVGEASAVLLPAGNSSPHASGTAGSQWCTLRAIARLGRSHHSFPSAACCSPADSTPQPLQPGAPRC